MNKPAYSYELVLVINLVTCEEIVHWSWTPYPDGFEWATHAGCTPPGILTQVVASCHESHFPRKQSGAR